MKTARETAFEWVRDKLGCLDDAAAKDCQDAYLTLELTKRRFTKVLDDLADRIAELEASAK